MRANFVRSATAFLLERQSALSRVLEVPTMGLARQNTNPLPVLAVISSVLGAILPFVDSLADVVTLLDDKKSKTPDDNPITDRQPFDST